MLHLEQAVRDGDWMALAYAHGLDVSGIIAQLGGSPGRSRLLDSNSVPVGTSHNSMQSLHEFCVQTGEGRSAMLRIIPPIPRYRQLAGSRIFNLAYDGTTCAAEEPCPVWAHRVHCYEYDEEGDGTYNSCERCMIDAHHCSQCNSDGQSVCLTHGCIHPINYF